MNRRNALKNISIGMGVSISTGTLLTMISSCKSDKAEADTISSWSASFLKNKDHLTLVENLAEAIMPATSTPGAKEAGVIQYIDMAVANLYETKKQERFQKGLEQCIAALEAENKGTAFTKLSTEQISAFLNKHIGSTADKATYDATKKLTGSDDLPTDQAQHNNYYLYSFLHAVKSLTVGGYFGSELIATKHMNFQPVPGPFEGCIDYSGNDYSLY
jgi:Gluconate 2-dehydrogenase subunit 3